MGMLGNFVSSIPKHKNMANSLLNNKLPMSFSMVFPAISENAPLVNSSGTWTEAGIQQPQQMTGMSGGMMYSYDYVDDTANAIKEYNDALAIDKRVTELKKYALDNNLKINEVIEAFLEKDEIDLWNRLPVLKYKINKMGNTTDTQKQEYYISTDEIKRRILKSQEGLSNYKMGTDGKVYNDVFNKNSIITYITGNKDRVHNIAN